MVEEAQEEDEEETRRTERDLCHEGNAPTAFGGRENRKNDFLRIFPPAIACLPMRMLFSDPRLRKRRSFGNITPGRASYGRACVIWH